MIIPRFSIEISLTKFLRISKGLKRFSKIATENILFFNSATEALCFYLKYLSNKKQLIIGVPLYSCSSIYQSIICSGNIIKFLDIGLWDDRYIIKFDELEELDVLIFIHYFGFRYHDLDAIYNKYPNLIIIEDCSHLSLSNYETNKYSSAALFSFNFHKPDAAGSGGALFFNNPEQKKEIQFDYHKMTTNTIFQNFKLIIRILLKNIGFHPFIYTLFKPALENKRKKSIPNIEENITCHKINVIAKYLIGNNFNHSDNTYKENYLNIPYRYRLGVNETNVKYLSYYPVFLYSKHEKNIFKNYLNSLDIDGYLLWENSLLNSTYYGLHIHEGYSNTIDMLDRTLFLPEPLIRRKSRLSKVIEFFNNGRLNRLQQ